MKIATWNVNSINQRLEHLKNLLIEENIDIVLLQETKCENHNFPKKEIEDLGYNLIIHGQKAYNGVAVISKCEIELISNQLLNDEEARYLEVVSHFNNKTLRLINIYAPHGQSVESLRFEYKMQFYEKLNKKIEILLKKDELLIVAGDLNIAPENIDVYDYQKLDKSMGFHIKERMQLRRLFNIGLTDLFRIKNPKLQEFSWWDYRSLGFQYNRGMRIDHILGSCGAVDILKDCYILKKVRALQKPSDHVPVICKVTL